MSDDRQMIHFPMGDRLFNHRTAGIAIRDGHVLVCREDKDDYTLLPGGRVEFGEDSRTSLEREIVEELKTPGDVKRLVFSVENFFARSARQFHEIALYYELALPADFPFRSNKVALTTQDEGHDLHFIWVPIADDFLAAVNLLPRWLHAELGRLPAEPTHLVMDER